MGASTAFAGFFFGIIITSNRPFFDKFDPIQTKGLPGTYSVTSGSMEPTIKTGGLVLSIPIAAYKTGDIVTFKELGNPKVLVTHRIIAKTYSEKTKDFVYYTKGDANKTIDSTTITPGQILGKVVLGLPFLGYAANSARDPKMFILFVIVPATIVVYEELKFLKKEFAKLLSKILQKIKSRKRFVNIDLNTEIGISKKFALIPIFGVLIILSGVTGSFFTDSKNSTSNTLATSNQFPTPVPTTSPSSAPNCQVEWASGTELVSQGLKKDGSAVAADRSDVTKAFGIAESNGLTDDNPVTPGTFYSLGFGGIITLSFTNPVVNVPGPDLQIYEITGGTYPEEKVKVEVSQDNSIWQVISPSVSRDAQIDINPLPWVKYIRLTDVSNSALFDNTADGYDLDAIKANCTYNTNR